MAKEALTINEVVTMMVRVADAIIDAEPELTDADRNLGDGDHGLGMQRGMNAVKEKLADGGFESIDEVIKTVGMSMMSSMGGASGAVFGTLFRAGGKALSQHDKLDAAAFADFLRAAADGVMARGGAKPGDKTMVDALEPAAAKAADQNTATLPESATAAAEAAAAGREASKDMIATMGRAKTLGEKSIGFPDAGACSVAIILRAMADYISED